jgi:hypothetical protein
MIVNEAFGHKYGIQRNVEIPEKILGILMRQIDLYLKDDDPDKHGRKIPEADGDAKTLSTVFTSHDFAHSIRSIPYFNKLYQVLLPHFDEGCRLLGIENRGEIVRAWANKMFKGASGKLHSHPMAKIVFILYIDCPEGSSSLIMSDITDYNVPYKDIPLDRQHIIPVEKHMLVCHDGEISHAISEHQSDLPRSCIIFEF